MKPPLGRTGKPLMVRKRPLEFSRWAMRPGKRWWALNSRLFATDPWPVIRRSIHDAKLPKAVQAEAVAYVGQAHAFYRGAAEAALSEAQPLLLYYCFLNLAKALILARRSETTLARAHHGLWEKLHSPSGRELLDAYLEAKPTTPLTPAIPATPAKPAVPAKPANLMVFDLLWKALGGAGVSPSPQMFDLPKLLPQIVPGHRLWAAGARAKERFVAADALEMLEGSGSVWVELLIESGDLSRFGISHKNLLRDSGLAPAWQQVKATKKAIVQLETIAPTPCGSPPSDRAMDAIGTIAPHLWTTVRSDPPYRTYYLYMCPPAEVGSRMPQLCSIYAIAFYLGSITRYRPHHFTKIIDGPFGPFVEAFLNDQPSQFLYLMASEFAQREVTRAALA